MEKTVVTIKRVNKFDSEKSSSVSVLLDAPIKGFAFDKDANSFIEADVNHISFGSWELEKVLCSLNDDIDYLRAMLGHAFDQSTFTGILYKAKLSIERKLYKAGDELNGKAVERDMFITSVIDVKLGERGQMFLDAMIDDIMSKAINA